VTEWPALELSSWDDTRATFHMWTQIVGKIRLGLEPMVNHWWQVTLYVSARGLTTSLMPTAQGGLEIELDVVDDVVQLRSTDGRVRHVGMEPRTVASFYADMMSALDDLDVPVRISTRPNEVLDAIPFPDDDVHRAYDGDAVRAYWQQLVHAHRVMQRFRGEFIGKCSPVHYFWGGADLAVTRFSGRVAPKHAGGVPNCPDYVQVEAYSHEVSSAGFWAGGGAEGAFYSYAYPAPDGFGQQRVRPDAARFDETLGEFLLPYEAVRTAPDPDAFLLEFLRSTYVAAAELAQWDRAALEASWAQ
jgi:hypothetical protein